MKITKAMLENWNHLRHEAGEEPIDRAMAEAVLEKVDKRTRDQMLQRLEPRQAD